MHLQLIRLNPPKAMFYLGTAQIKELPSFFGLPEATGRLLVCNVCSILGAWRVTQGKWR